MKNRIFIAGNKEERERNDIRVGMAKTLLQGGERLPYRLMIAYNIFRMCFCDTLLLPREWSESCLLRLLQNFATITGMIVIYEE